jgi:transposase
MARMAAISMDLRVRIFDARQAGDSTGEVAERFSVSPAFVRRLLQRYRDTGHLAPKTGPRGPKPKLVGRHDEIRNHNAQHPDHSPAEVAAALKLPASVSTVARAFVALGLTFKKNAARLRTRPS